MNDQLTLQGDDGAELAEAALCETEKARGLFSGVNLQKYDPEKYQLILEMLSSGKFSMRMIGRATKTSTNLVSAIRKSQEVEIESLRAKLSRGAAHVAELCQERQVEILTDPDSKIRLGELAVAQGVAIDKMQVLSGGATSRLEVVVGAGPDHDDFVKEMGLSAGNGGQKARVIDVEADELRPARIPAASAASVQDGNGAGKPPAAVAIGTPDEPSDVPGGDRGKVGNDGGQDEA